jgi:hypothetical protein
MQILGVPVDPTIEEIFWANKIAFQIHYLYYDKLIPNSIEDMVSMGISVSPETLEKAKNGEGEILKRRDRIVDFPFCVYLVMNDLTNELVPETTEESDRRIQSAKIPIQLDNYKYVEQYGDRYCFSLVPVSDDPNIISRLKRYAILEYEEKYVDKHVNETNTSSKGWSLFGGADMKDESDPIQNKPTVDQPTVDQPTVGQPVADQPTVDQPTVDQPVADQPTVGQPVVDQPMEDQPTVGQPVADQPTVGQPVADQPTVGQPVVDQPTVDQPVVDQPTADQPTADTNPNVESPIETTSIEHTPNQESLDTGPVPLPVTTLDDEHEFNEMTVHTIYFVQKMGEKEVPIWGVLSMGQCVPL